MTMTDSLWFDPDPPSLAPHEERLQEHIHEGTTDDQLQERLDRSCSDVLLDHEITAPGSRPLPGNS